VNKELSYRNNLHRGASQYIHQNAKNLRQKLTEAEKKLWGFLRNRQLNGRKFRRQHPLSKYILDFYCHECKLAIELDGIVHDKEAAIQYDNARTGELNDLGITVIRFRNEEVINGIETVLKKICDQLPPPLMHQALDIQQSAPLHRERAE
jgi:very-short-patch-repair endonuclease